MKSKIVIFETTKEDGIMSKNKKFYDDSLSEEERMELYHNTRLKLGKKLGINGNHIFIAHQKGQFPIEHPDGEYILLEDKHMKKEDFYNELLPADILIINEKYKSIAVGNPCADCPIVICEDRKKGYTALAHCGASYIDRELPKDIIKALKKCCNSKEEDIYVYISSCIKKDSYVYDRYPKWAKNKPLWNDYIIRKDNYYYIDLVGAIIEQLKELNIKNIETSSIDTYKDKNYYSHAADVNGIKDKIGQNFVGFFYK